MTTQLPLAIRPQEQMTFANYIIGQNQFAVTALQQSIRGTGEWYIYLWGEQGTGRSHLLQACSHQAQQQQLMVQYLPLAELISYSPQLLEGLEAFNIVCLDDIQLIAGKREWQEAVFHLYNRIQLAQHHLIISAAVPPLQLDLSLLDLKSRLSAGLIMQLHELDDDSMLRALQIHARQRGLELPKEVGQFLLKRLSRTLPALLDTLEQLDLASLAAQRRLTVPFVKAVLAQNS